MRHEVLASELIKSLRGARSQTAFSRHLGYRCNVLYTWESGRRWPTAAVFLRLALKARIELLAGLKRFLGTSPHWLNKNTEFESLVGLLLTHLRGGTSMVELSRRVASNRVSVSRWLNNQAEPRLPDFLRLIEATSGRLLDFVAIFVEPHRLPECQSMWKELQAQREVAYELPWSHAVLRSLELAAYRALPAHQEGWIAERLSIPVQLEKSSIEALAASGLIVRRKKHWVVSKVLTVDTRANPEAGARLKEHWADVGRRRLRELEPHKTDLFSYNLFAVSETDFERLRELHIAYFQELRSIVAQSEPGERLVLANLQLLRLDEPVSRAASTPAADEAVANASSAELK